MDKVGYFAGILDLFLNKVKQLLNFDFQEVKFENLNLAYLISSFLAVIFVVNFIVWILRRKKERFIRKHSGSAEYLKHKVSIWSRFLPILSKWLVSIPAVFLIISLADPHLVEVTVKKILTSARIRVELRDTSTSMEDPFPQTKITKAEIGEEKHFEFLKMREGKGDRVSLWLFASSPYLIQEFVAHDEFYKLKAHNAPIVTFSENRTKALYDYSLKLMVPLDKYGYIYGEGGGTAITTPLRQIINQFKADPVSNTVNPKTNKLPDRSILIVTDAEVDEVPKAELVEIKQMGIKIFVIWIPSQHSIGAPPFLQKIREDGGKYWDVRTPDAIREAYKEIDSLQPAEYEESKMETKKDLSDVFLFCAVISIFFIVLSGLAISVPRGLSP